MKINVGIVGYGNLGKATEQEILKNTNYNLVAIFSRRLVSSQFNTTVEPYENFKNYTGKIDIMFLCGGSLSDLEIQTPEILQYFDCLNTFDTHAKIKSEFEKLDKIAKKNNNRLIFACGWDPGLFSVTRALFYAITKQEPVCFWGKGISMGHSDAIRHVDGVADGVQFTIPNKQAVSLAKKGFADKTTPKHFRECFVVSHDTNKNNVIEKKIKCMPNYFLNQPTKVTFVSHEKLLQLKKQMSHKGEIFGTSSDSKIKLSMNVKMQSNPMMTAKILVAYAKAVTNLKKRNTCGAFTPMHIPVSFLFDEKQTQLMFSLC